MISIALCRWSSAILPPKRSGRGFSIEPTPGIRSWQGRSQCGATILRSQLPLLRSDLPRPLLDSRKAAGASDFCGLCRSIGTNTGLAGDSLHAGLRF
jgi:hypothetical protein